MNDPILQRVKIEEIEVGERFRQDYGNLNELVHSYKKHGFFSVIALGHNDSNTTRPYKLLVGGRRLKALELKGMTEVNACIYDRELTELELREMELDENVYRKDLSWQENAELTARVHELQSAIHGRKISTSPNAPGWSQAMTAEKMGKSVGQVSQALALAEGLKLLPELQNCKTADEARKRLLNLGNKMKVEDLAEKIRSQTAATPIGKLRTDLVNRFILADFFDGIKGVPDNSMDLIEIDPPYGIDLVNAKKLEVAGIDTKIDAYNEIDFAQYPYFVQRTVTEAWRVLKPTGWIIFWFAHEPWFEYIYQTLSKQGFLGDRMVGIWQKRTGQSKRPEFHLANVTEMFFYMRKSNGYIQRPRTNVFEYPSVPPQKKIHPTERPIELVMELLRTFCLPGANICVPFLGSGNTILAASNLGMSAIGWDISQEYKDRYTLRVHDSEPGMYTSYTNLEAII